MNWLRRQVGGLAWRAARFLLGPDAIGGPDTSVAPADYLGAALMADPDAIKALLMHWVPCDESLADVGEVIVRSSSQVVGRYTASVLGLINGLLVAMGEPTVGMIVDVDDYGDRVIIGFEGGGEDPQADRRGLRSDGH